LKIYLSDISNTKVLNNSVGRDKIGYCLKKKKMNTEKRLKNKAKDFTGEKFGKLTVISLSHISKHNHRHWFCLCECGGTSTPNTNSLTCGHTISCGCHKSESATKHGFLYHPLYIVYRGLIRRCYVTYNKDYENYGGSGILICEEWLRNPRSFFEWSLKNGWKRGLHLDRYPNKSGWYSPDNCRYVTCKENILSLMGQGLGKPKQAYLLLLASTTIFLFPPKFDYPIYNANQEEG